MARRRTHQPWEADSGARAQVLLECEADATPSVIASVIERNGFAVRTCEGPDAHDCDLLEHGACHLVDGADVVVNMLRNSAAGPRVLDEMVGLRRPPTMVAEVPHSSSLRAIDSDGSEDSGDPARVTIVNTPVNEGALIGAIEEALERSEQPVPRWGDAHC